MKTKLCFAALFLVASLLLGGCVTVQKPITVIVRTTPADAKRTYAWNTPDAADPIAVFWDSVILLPPLKPAFGSKHQSADILWVTVSKSGYVSQQFSLTPGAGPLDVVLVKEEDARNTALIQELEIQRAKTAAHPEWSDAVKAWVLNSEIGVGMPLDAVQAVKGEPRSKTTSDGVGGRTEFWHYYSMTLYFRDGQLVRWTQHSGT